jgi:serine protease Do
VRLTLIALLFVFASGTVAAQDRLTKVRNDRQNVIDDGYWLYNDLPAAREQAKETGKPILVVIRCIPCEHCAGLDQDVVKPDPATKKLMDQFVRVRVVHANGLDLSQFQYDFDLSFSALVMNADGTIYTRYGNRSSAEDVADNPIEGFRATLAAALDVHKNLDQHRADLKDKKAQLTKFDRPEKYPSLSRYKATVDFSGTVVKDCLHCHQIRDAERELARRENGTIPDEILFPFPRPEVIGLLLDPGTKATVKGVATDSAAAEAGFHPGDKITSIAAQPILSLADFQWALEVADRIAKAPDQDLKIPCEVVRGDVTKPLTLKLAPDWRKAQDISWRPTTWELRAMGLGGLFLKEVSDADRKKLGLADDALALRVEHAGMYDKHAGAYRAGIRKDDILVEFDGIKVRRSESQLIARGVQERKPGDKVAVAVLRGGKRLEFTVPVQ